MQVQGDSKPYDDINITPMLDLSYVLLIIFIIMCTASVQGLKIDLPKAPKKKSVGASSTKAITLTRDGQIMLDTFPVTHDQLRKSLVELKKHTPEFPIVLRGDSQVEYQTVMNVIEILKDLNLQGKASFATQAL